jgi:hypothetical protein
VSKKRKSNSGNPAKDPHKDDGFVWVKTERTLDETGWMVTVEIDGDNAIALTENEAPQYVYGVLDAAARAEYDAAVLAQIGAKVDREHAMRLIVDLRRERPPLRATRLLDLLPGVSVKGEPFIGIEVNGKQVGQWDVADARLHAMHVMEAVVTADLDAGYLRALKGIVGLDDSTAHAAVADLANWRK